MAKFCTKCGTQMDDNAQFCPSCGTPAGQTQTNQQPGQEWQQAQSSQQPGQEWQDKVNQGAENFQKATQMNDYTSRFHPQDIQDNKGFSVLSYIGILALIPFCSQRGKSSPYTRFHATQGMYLFLCQVAASIVTTLLGLIRINRSIYGIVYESYTPWPIAIIQWLIGLVSLAYSVLGIVFAATGQAKDLPLLGKLRKLGWFK